MILAVILKDWQAIIILIFCLIGGLTTVVLLFKLTWFIVEMSIKYKDYKEYYITHRQHQELKKFFDEKMKDLDEFGEYIKNQLQEEEN